MDNKDETTEVIQDDTESCNGTDALCKDKYQSNERVNNKARFGGYVIESLVIFCAALPSLNIGYAIGFSSPAARDFEVHETQLNLTTEQTTWFGSLLVLTAIAGSIACGVFMDKFGRKLSILLQLLIYASGWVSISLSGISCRSWSSFYSWESGYFIQFVPSDRHTGSVRFRVSFPMAKPVAYWSHNSFYFISSLSLDS
uniref:Major facilitator superfamily (MFS) profile domain-containing protein n=1 Tax=Ciona intestinalis TaxID=7719 RepID=F6UPG6_CIOIN